MRSIYHTLTHTHTHTHRTIYCDIGGSDPERMSPPKTAEYILEAFKDTCIKVCC